MSAKQRAEAVSVLLQRSLTKTFVRPPCSVRLTERFAEELERSGDDTQWAENWINLRQMTDRNQEIVKGMGRLRPPKNERSVMEAIARRVGVEMPKSQKDMSQEELEYFFHKFSIPFEEFNQPVDQGHSEEESTLE